MVSTIATIHDPSLRPRCVPSERCALRGTSVMTESGTNGHAIKKAIAELPRTRSKRAPYFGVPMQDRPYAKMAKLTPILPGQFVNTAAASNAIKVNDHTRLSDALRP